MSSLAKPLILLLAMLWGIPCPAQHTHGVLTPGTTFPKDDAALKAAPKSIVLSFRVKVRLLKLVLLTDERQWVDIGFRYDPERVGGSFVFPLEKSLPSANYYVIEWSVLDLRRNRLMNGEFKFSFGDGALPPSDYIEALIGEPNENLPSTGAYRGGN